MENEDDINIISGASGEGTLGGTDGNDLFVDLNGQEALFGGDGLDTVVFDGPASEFEIDAFGLGNAGVFDGENVVDLQDIEFVQFDDETVSILDFVDDFGVTRDTAALVKLDPVGGIFEEPPFISKIDIENPIISPIEKLVFPRVAGFRKAKIDATGDVDGFTAFLTAGVTYIIDATAFSFDLEQVNITGVFDPNDVLIEGTDDASYTVEFVAETTGQHLFTAAASDDSVGFYEVNVNEVRLFGDSGDNDLLGTNGADTLEGGGGDDFIDGNGGVDVAVFAGNREDHDIFPGLIGVPLFPGDFEFAAPRPGDYVGPSLVVLNDDLEEFNDVQNVEILRFDDGDVSVLEFVDDFGDDLDTAGVLELKTEKLGKKFAATAETIGRIDAIGDVDAFAVTLDAGETFAVLLEENNFFFDVAGPENGEESTESNFPFVLESVLDPDGNAVELRTDTRFEEETDDGALRSFQSSVAGTYLISVAGLGENVGSYGMELFQLNDTGTENGDFFFGSPFDDTIDAAGGDDVIFFSGGTDSIDGGEGIEDTVFANGTIEGFDFSVSEDGAIKLEGPDGDISTITNVEFFEFEGEESDEEILAEDILAFAEQVEEDEEFSVKVAEDGGDDLSGDLGNDAFLGGDGDDTFTDPGGNSSVDAGEGSDRVGLVSGSNSVDGGSEDDLIIGGIGTDNLSGGSGNDIIIGDVSTNLFGSDRITGGTDNDLLEGRGGQDTFVFATGDGTDTIGTIAVDFETLENSTVTGADFVSGLDLIELVGFGFADQDAAFANVTDVDGVATFSDQGTTIVFNGLTVNDLSSDDFILV